MFDLLASIGSAVAGDVIKRAIQGGVNWAKSRKSAKPAEVEQKAAELVDRALDRAVEKTPALGANLSAEQRQQIVTEITGLTLPTFKQVIEFDQRTRQVISAAKKAAPKKVAKKKATAKKATVKRTAAKKAAMKKSAVRKSAAKRVARRR